MIQISPFSNLRVFVSEKRDGSVNSPQEAQALLQKYQFQSPICYFHHHHQADRHLLLSKPQNSLQEVWADAVLSNQQVCLAMKVADCFPIVLSSKKSQVIALIHGGWKPLLQNIIELSVLDLRLTYKLNPKDLYAWIGPGIHNCCYHFEDKPIQADLRSWQSFVQQKDDHWEIDLAKYIKQELNKQGIKKESIIDFDQCTCCNDETFFSHYSQKVSKNDQERMLVAVEMI